MVRKISSERVEILNPDKLATLTAFRMDPYEYFDHPYWDTRKSRRPGKKYVNPYMPVPSEVAKHGSEFSDRRCANSQHIIYRNLDIVNLRFSTTAWRDRTNTSKKCRLQGKAGPSLVLPPQPLTTSAWKERPRISTSIRSHVGKFKK